MSEQPTLFSDEPQRDPVADAERRRDEGMNRAAARQPDRVTLGRLAFISALLRSPTGTATIDDGTPPDELAGKYPDGGHWRGSVSRTLAADGYMQKTGEYRPTRRPSGRCRPNAVWQLLDREKAERYVRRMTAALAVYDTTPPVAADGVAKTDTTHTNDQGDLSSDESK